APITPIEDLPDLPFVASAALKTVAPDGRTVRLPPPAVRTEHLGKTGGSLPFAPAYGEHTDSLLQEAGLSSAEIASLRKGGVVA
ncbi:MAG: CoA transferase, partial [Planctomycetota bacterium]